MKYLPTVDAVKKIISDYSYALTLRQIFYRLVSDYRLPNTRAKYTALSRHLVTAREQGDIPINCIEDRSRNIIRSGDIDDGDPDVYFDLEIDSLKSMALTYSMSMWDTQDIYVEVWVEKDALANVISNVASKWKVLVAPSRGYSSFSYIYDAVKRFKASNADNRLVLHFADHDPSGLNMTDDLFRRLRAYGADVTIKRVALTYDQVQDYNLVPNPTKKGDPRNREYKKLYGDECWELDALPPKVLQGLVETSIKNCIDMVEWDARLKELEENQDYIQDKIDEFFSNMKEG